MANGANLTVEQFTETVAKQIAADLKLDGTDFVNRLVSSLSKGLIDKIAQKQITSPIIQQLENQQQETDKSSKELEKLNKTSTSTNTNIQTHLPKLVEGINILGQKMQNSFQLLSKDFTGAIGKTNSIFKSFTDKLIDVSGFQRKEDKFPHLIKRQFVSLEKHLTELFKTKDQKTQIEPQQLSLGDLLKDLKGDLKEDILSKIEGVSLKDLFKTFPEDILSKIEGVSLKNLKGDLKEDILSKIEGVSLKDLFKTFPEDILSKIEGVSLKDLFKTFPEEVKNNFLQNVKGLSLETLLQDVPEDIKSVITSKIEELSLTDLFKTVPEDIKSVITSKIEELSLTDLFKTVPEEIKNILNSKIETVSLKNLPEQIKDEIVIKFQGISFVNFKDELQRAIVEKIKGVSFEDLPKQVAREIKTIFENSTTQREQTKQFQDLGKNQNEHLKKAVETLRYILGSSEELVKLQNRTEAQTFSDAILELPRKLESVVIEKAQNALFSVIPKQISSKITEFVFGKKNKEEDTKKQEFKELKEVIKASQKEKPKEQKSALEAARQEAQPVVIQDISNQAVNNLFATLPRVLQFTFRKPIKDIEKIADIIEKIPNILERISNDLSVMMYADLLGGLFGKKGKGMGVPIPGGAGRPTGTPPVPGGKGLRLPSWLKGAKGAGILTTLVAAGFTAMELSDIAQAEQQGELTPQQAKKQKAGAIGGGIGGAAGGIGGVLAGAALGQALIPIPGVGAFVGGLAGSVGGGMLGDFLGRSAGEALVGDETQQQQVKVLSETALTTQPVFIEGIADQVLDKLSENITAKQQAPQSVQVNFPSEQSVSVKGFSQEAVNQLSTELPKNWKPLQQEILKPTEQLPTIESIKEAPELKQVPQESINIEKTVVETNASQNLNNEAINKISSAVDIIKNNTSGLVDAIRGLKPTFAAKPQEPAQTFNLNMPGVFGQPPSPKSTEIAKEYTSPIPRNRADLFANEPQYA